MYEVSKIYKKRIVDLAATGLNIKFLRQQKGFSVKELQLIFNFEHPQAIYNWESGKALPSIDNLLVLADLFCTNLEDIVKTYSIQIEIKVEC